MPDRGFTHLDPLGRARMVDVTPKEPTHRRAKARCRVLMKPETASAVARGAITIHDATGADLASGPRFALCRCGNSANKPFCDNTHRAIAFKAP